MKEISPKMKRAIKNMELALNVKFTGSTFDEASKFISENYEKSKKVDLREKMPPSPKMKKAIEFCEDVLKVEFQGSNMKEASEFLNEYLDKASFEVNRNKSGRRK
jgi:ubiquitin C-terminal hydrolase